MIDHGVEHHAEMLTDLAHIFPRAQGRIDLRVIDHRETIIRGEGIERQDMYTADQPKQVALHKLSQGTERRDTRILYLIAIGNQQDIALGEPLAQCWTMGRSSDGTPNHMLLDQRLQARECTSALLLTVEKR